MARVPYVERDAATQPLASLYDSAERMTGRVPNFHKILGHVPETYRWYLPFQVSLQRDDTGSHLTRELRALAHLATSEANRCTYCATHNSAHARKRGLTDAQVDWLAEASIDDDPPADLFDTQQRLVVRWVRAVTKNQARRASSLFAELGDVFTPPQIVELTVVAAARTFTNLIQEALWTDLEDEEAGQADGLAPVSPRVASRGSLRADLCAHADLAAEQLREDAPEVGASEEG